MKHPEYSISDSHIYVNGNPLDVTGFTPLRLLGIGASGAVFEASDVNLRRNVAIKVWHELSTMDESRAMAESRRLAELDHPLIAKIYSIQICNQRLISVLELVEGEPLKTSLRNKALSVRKRHLIAGQFIAGMNYIYSKSMLHGDPHTGNIICQKSSEESTILPGRSRYHSLGNPCLKIIDLGSSSFKTDRSQLESREKSVLAETFRRLLYDFPVSSILRAERVSSGREMLHGLEAIVELYRMFNWRFKKEEPFMWTQGLSPVLTKNPFVSLRGVAQLLERSTNGSDDVNSLYVDVDHDLGDSNLQHHDYVDEMPGECARIEKRLERYQDEIIKASTSNLSA